MMSCSLFGVIVSGVGLSAAEKTTLIQLEASSILKESPTRRAVVPKRAYRSSAIDDLTWGQLLAGLPAHKRLNCLLSIPAKRTVFEARFVQ
jgi:hypothetical protein